MRDLSINDINTAIMFGDWTNDNINSMIAAIKYARNQLGKNAKRSLVIGDAVRFVGRSGRSYNGSITKIMQKNCVVRTTCGTSYRVPANMLEKAA